MLTSQRKTRRLMLQRRREDGALDSVLLESAYLQDQNLISQHVALPLLVTILVIFFSYDTFLDSEFFFLFFFLTMLLVRNTIVDD